MFGALVQIMSDPGPDFDPDRLLSTLSSRKADEWSQCVAGLTGGYEREVAFRNTIIAAYKKLSVQTKKK